MKRYLLTLMLLCLTAIAFAQKDTLVYSKKQVVDDIRYLLKNAADIHPNLYHDISERELTRKTDSLINKLPDSLSMLNAYRVFAEGTAFVNEGHTSLNVPTTIRKQIKAGTFRSIPLKVNDYSDSYFDAEVVSGANNGEQIKVIAINGYPAGDIFNRMMRLKGGLPSFRQNVVLGNFRLNMRVLGIPAPYTVKYLEQGGRVKTMMLAASTESEYQSLLDKPKVEKLYTFAVINGSVGYLNFRSMMDYDKFAKFCDSIFKEIDERKVTKLVIDLRENSGGNSGLGWYLLNYITDTPYRMAGESERRISQQFKDYITANSKLYGTNGEAILKQPTGSFYKMPNDGLNTLPNLPYKYKGRACFLIGPYTFSSANMTAATVMDFKLATLIGEPTGEPANDYGEICNISLPSTGQLAFTSTTLWTRPNNNKADRNPVLPDYLVKRSGPGDNVLEYAIEWLDGKK